MAHDNSICNKVARFFNRAFFGYEVFGSKNAIKHEYMGYLTPKIFGIFLAIFEPPNIACVSLKNVTTLIRKRNW